MCYERDIQRDYIEKYIRYQLPLYIWILIDYNTLITLDTMIES